MKAELLSVGTELLLGDIINTNAQFISKELAALGINVYFQTTVGDNPDRLKNAYELAFSRSDLVITTGGLGPTCDDLTKETAAKVFNKNIILDEEYLVYMTEYFKKQNFRMTENNKKQAYIIEGSIAMKNNNGTAPGLILEADNKILIMLPGPPKEMIPMFKKSVLPYLSKKQKRTYISRSVNICGVGESSAEDMIKDLIDNQTNPTIAPYAKQNQVSLRVTASAKDEKEANDLIEPIVNELYKRFGENIFGENEDTLESVLCKMLIDKDLTIALAESATGGMIASRLVSYAGVSKTLKEGLVTYSNESKIARLGVKEETLQRFGAVSEQCAKEMAVGVMKTSGTDIGLSVTGIAGPDGATKDKKVGLMYVGFAYKDIIKVLEFNYIGNRERIRERTATNAIDFLRREIMKI